MSDQEQDRESETEGTLRLATDIVSAYVRHNQISAAELPDMIKTIHDALDDLQVDKDEPKVSDQKPAVPIRRSITPEYLVCLEDGKRLKMLKRYLRSTYNMTPEEYRAKWGLPPDYPMVAPNYAAQRSAFAKRIGLGRGTKTETSQSH